MQKKHPIRAKFGLQEPRLDDPISGRKHCRLSKSEQGLEQIIMEKYAALAEIRCYERTKAATDVLLLESDRQRTRAAERTKTLDIILMVGNRGQSCHRRRDADIYGRQSPHLERQNHFYARTFKI